MSTRTGKSTVRSARPHPESDDTRSATARTHSANTAFKEGARRRATIAVLVALAGHTALIALSPTWRIDDSLSPPAVRVADIALIPDIAEPSQRAPIAWPAPPVEPELAVPKEITVPALMIEEERAVFDEIPPLPETESIGEIAEFADYEHVSPSMVAPELVNRAEVQRALERNYPIALQRARVEGTLTVWFWIDEEGAIQKYEIRSSSGNEELDEAAETVIETMEFRPAVYQGKTVPVIVTLPIVFEVR